MTIDAETLQQMISEDDLGLLDLPVKSAPVTRDQRLVSSFAEIEAFVEEHGREPAIDSTDIAEIQLGHRLQALRLNEEHRVALEALDQQGLLREPEPPRTIADAVASDPFGLLGAAAHDIHELRHVSQEAAKPDWIARREPCEDFEQFEPLLQACQAELRAGKRRLVPFKNEQEIRQESFYVLRGVLTYVASEGERRKERGRVNARLRCIFENGTEADLLLRSLGSQLYRFGKQVTDPAEKTDREVIENLGSAVGYVYVMQSLSDDPQVVEIPDLHKIGYTAQDPSERAAGAKQSSTFLGAEVAELQVFEMPRSMGRGVEHLLHRFFASARIDAWFEQNGRTSAEVNEWFSVPLGAIEEAVHLISAESIESYQYDPVERRITLRSALD